MGRKLTISPKHGLNPSLLICPVCGNDSNGIAIFGRLKGDEEAPRKVLDPEPCETCKFALEAGVILVEVRDGEEGKEDPYRTGYIVALKLDAAERIFKDVDFNKNRVLYIEQSILKMIMGDQYGVKIDKPETQVSEG